MHVKFVENPSMTQQLFKAVVLHSLQTNPLVVNPRTPISLSMPRIQLLEYFKHSLILSQSTLKPTSSFNHVL